MVCLFAGSFWFLGGRRVCRVIFVFLVVFGRFFVKYLSKLSGFGELKAVIRIWGYSGFFYSY